MNGERLKITIVGPAHPYRGGLAAIMETMAREYSSRGHQVEILTFTLQYPGFLFPGKSQTVDTPPPGDLSIERAVSTIDPLSWIKVGRRLRRQRPDIVLMKYWTPFMAPCFGTIARIARKNGHTKVLCQIDNVEPHERHLVDKPLNRYFLNSVDGFVYMSEQVHRELAAYTSAPALFSPHPMFENFGTHVDRDEACRELGIDPSDRYALFFGLIRDYKGLDTLLEAWSRFRRQGHKLIVAGEFYASREKYIELIKREQLEDDVILHDFFVADGGRLRSAAIQKRYPERRDADSIQFLHADDRNRCRRSLGDRARRRGRIRLPADRGRRIRFSMPHLRGRYARPLRPPDRNREAALLVGGDVRPYRGAVRHRAEEIG